MADFLGGPTKGGPTHGGPTNGGPTKNVVLSDSYADSLYAEALTRHRGGIVDMSPEVNQALWTIGDDSANARRIFRWDPWVRSYLAAYECTRYMDFEVVERPPKDKDYPLTVALNVRHPGPKAAELFRMTRPTRQVFEGQLKLVLDYAELRTERAAEILTQIPNQTPFWGALIPFHTDRMRRTAELLDIAVEMAVIVEMRFKHDLAAYRPTDYSWQVQPMITTPGHGSIPSGHCTQSYVTLTVLKALLNSGRPLGGREDAEQKRARESVNTQLERTAARISTNRVVAGVHFPVDNVAGRLLGTVLGDYFVYRCGNEPEMAPKFRWHRGEFNGLAFPKGDDFDPVRQPFSPGVKGIPKYYTYERPKGDMAPPPDSLLQTLWAEAVKELKALEQPFEDPGQPSSGK